MERLLSDAQELVARLRGHSGEASNVLAQARFVTMRVTAMKEYQQELNQLNALTQSKNGPNSSVSCLKDNAQIMELERSNAELHSLLDEHQAVLEIVMNKYRDQVLRLMNSEEESTNHLRSGLKAAGKVAPTDEMGETIGTIVAIANVMRDAAVVEEGGREKEQERIAQLQTENETLRELLRISSAAGSAPRQTRATQTSTDFATLKPRDGKAVNGTAVVSDNGKNSDSDESNHRRYSQESIDLDDEDDVLFQTMRPNKKSNEPLFAQHVVDSVNRSSDALKSPHNGPLSSVQRETTTLPSESGNSPISNGSVTITTEH